MCSKNILGLEDIEGITGGPYSRTVSPRALLRTLFVIMVAEHRRGGRHEPEGGRNLIVRFILGVIYDNWTAAEAISNIKEGKPGLRKLRWRETREPTFNEVLT
jgi:hypothetical protein